MAYEGYLLYNDTEIVNHGRLLLLAQQAGVSGVQIARRTVDTLLARTGQTEAQWKQVANAPWYDAQYPASAEFCGVLALSMQGLDDSSYSAEVTEYTVDGGSTSGNRNATQALVANVIFVGSTERGVEFGKRWLNRVLIGKRDGAACSGVDLHYLRALGSTAVTAEMVHRRDVSLTRAFSVTRQKRSACQVAQWVTFTLTDSDGYEYGDAVPKITSLGGATGTGPGVTSQGTSVLTQQACPEYNYDPLYDPAFPALVAPPAAPDFYPDGWTIKTGDTFQRKWARISPVEPSGLLTVPVIRLTATQEARMVRVAIWESTSPNDDQCGPLFSAVITYLPANQTFYIDAEQKAAYVHDGVSPAVRRTDSLVYDIDANPVKWAAFNDNTNLLVTLDTFQVSPGVYQGGGTVRVALDLVPKSD